jgi:GTP cyclohydrolase I
MERALAEQAVIDLLKWVGEDPSRDGLKDTPARVARALKEMTEGYLESPAAILGTVFEEPYDEMIVVRGIEYHSLCISGRQLVNAVGGAKAASEVRAGDKLWTLVDGLVQETEVVKVQSHATKETVEVVTDHAKMRVTPDHPFATPQGWEEASRLGGREIEWASSRQFCRERHPPVEGYVVGAVFSDGTVGDRYLSLVVNEQGFAEQFASHLARAFPTTRPEVEPVNRPSGFTGQDCPGYLVRVVSSYLADLFRLWAGGDAHHMRQQFPRVVLNTEEMAHGFVDGYCDGDGNRAATGTRRVITSGNVVFLEEMADVIGARFTPAKQGSLKLHISDMWHKEGWYGRHGFRQESHLTALLESKFVPVRSVRRVAPGNRPVTVYSFKCEPHPTFLVAGHLTHNCEHHLMTFTGTCDVAYIPNSRGLIVGLSKIPRLVQCFARRLQVQERLTKQIAEALERVVKPRGVGVVVRGHHVCCEGRGVRSRNLMVTSDLRGVFKTKPEVRGEFLALARGV